MENSEFCYTHRDSRRNLSLLVPVKWLIEKNIRAIAFVGALVAAAPAYVYVKSTIWPDDHLKIGIGFISQNVASSDHLPDANGTSVSLDATYAQTIHIGAEADNDDCIALNFFVLNETKRPLTDIRVLVSVEMPEDTVRRSNLSLPAVCKEFEEYAYFSRFSRDTLEREMSGDSFTGFAGYDISRLDHNKYLYLSVPIRFLETAYFQSEDGAFRFSRSPIKLKMEFAASGIETKSLEVDLENSRINNFAELGVKHAYLLQNIGREHFSDVGLMHRLWLRVEGYLDAFSGLTKQRTEIVIAEFGRIDAVGLNGVHYLVASERFDRSQMIGPPLFGGQTEEALLTEAEISEQIKMLCDTIVKEVEGDARRCKD